MPKVRSADVGLGGKVSPFFFLCQPTFFEKRCQGAMKTAPKEEETMTKIVEKGDAYTATPTDEALVRFGKQLMQYRVHSKTEVVP